MIHNFTEHTIPLQTLNLLAKGANFALTAPPNNIAKIAEQLWKTVRRVLLNNHFYAKPKQHKFFTSKNSSWYPRNDLANECTAIYQSILTKYKQAITRSKHKKLVDNSITNYKEALLWFNNKDIIVAQADKNLGLIIMNKTD